MSKLTEEEGKEVLEAFRTMRNAVIKIDRTKAFFNSQSEEEFIKAFENEDQAKEVMQCINEIENY